MLSRENKMRTALGGEAGTASWIAPKPKGMWQRTYDRKLLEAEWCEDEADRHYLSKFSHILSAEEREVFFAYDCHILGNLTTGGAVIHTVAPEE